MGLVWVILGGCLTASPAFAGGPDIVWAKAATPRIAMSAEHDACVREADTVGVELRAAYSQQLVDQGYGPVGVLVVGSAVGGFFSAVMTPGARANYVKSCMTGRGYQAIALSAAEKADRDARKTPEATAAWMDDFYGRPDIQQRLKDVAGAADGAAPGLPQLKSEAWAFQGVRIDPATLTPSTGAAAPNSVVIKGKVTYRRMARVKAAVDASSMRVAEGSTVYAFASSGGPTVWCGDMKLGIFGIGRSYCARSDKDKIKLLTLATDNPFLQTYEGSEASVSAESYQLDEQGVVPPEPMDFSITVRRIGAGGVSLVAQAMIKGEMRDIWTGDMLFNDQGVAVLPFWGSRLTLTRSGDGVTAAFTADGDGKGWEDADIGAVH